MHLCKSIETVVVCVCVCVCVGVGGCVGGCVGVWVGMWACVDLFRCDMEVKNVWCFQTQIQFRFSYCYDVRIQLFVAVFVLLDVMSLWCRTKMYIEAII